MRTFLLVAVVAVAACNPHKSVATDPAKDTPVVVLPSTPAPPAPQHQPEANGFPWIGELHASPGSGAWQPAPYPPRALVPDQFRGVAYVLATPDCKTEAWHIAAVPEQPNHSPSEAATATRIDILKQRALLGREFADDDCAEIAMRADGDLASFSCIHRQPEDDSGTITFIAYLRALDMMSNLVTVETSCPLSATATAGAVQASMVRTLAAVKY